MMSRIDEALLRVTESHQAAALASTFTESRRVLASLMAWSMDALSDWACSAWDVKVSAACVRHTLIPPTTADRAMKMTARMAPATVVARRGVGAVLTAGPPRSGG